MCFMEVAQDLKRRFLQMIYAIIGSRRSNEVNQDGEEPRLTQKVTVKERGVLLKVARGPQRRGIPRGPPAQTN
ncbi:hypothetical protein AB3S75_000196 [Citrus x aurantiifolia]